VSTLISERPDSADLADHAGTWRSAYLHFPFCARLCPYCDFAVVAGRDAEQQRYLAALSQEIAFEESWASLDALYLGGGTPSRADPGLVAAVLAGLDVAEDAEISLEANPEDWTLAGAQAWRAAGFNRVSFGAQSFDPATLRYLGRRHDPDHIRRAVGWAREAGFRSVNLDLIFGAPGEDGWVRSLEAALALEPDHLSCYALTVEPGTELHRRVLGGETAPDPDRQADQWELAEAMAGAAGLVRYEVSNWARPGHAVRYNLAVWAQGEYLAYGLGAHRFRDRVRSHNYRHLETYLAAVERGERPQAGAEVIEGWIAEVERVFLGIRRAAGVVAGAAGHALLAAPAGEQLLAAGVIEVVGDRLVVRRPLLTDAVSRALLSVARAEVGE